MQKASVLVAALISACLIPTGAAVIEEKGSLVFETPAKALLSAELTFRDEDATDLRTVMDADGSEDVSADEVDAFEDAMREESESEGVGDEVTVDGKQATQSEIGSLDVHDAVGPVTKTGPVVINMQLTATFPVTPKESHVIVMKQDTGSDPNQDFGEDKGGYVEVPSGYTIKSTSQLPQGASLSADKKRITFTGAEDDEIEQLEITIEKASTGGGAGAKGLAGPGTFLVALAFVAAGRALRRTR